MFSTAFYQSLLFGVSCTPVLHVPCILYCPVSLQLGVSYSLLLRSQRSPLSYITVLRSLFSSSCSQHTVPFSLVLHLPCTLHCPRAVWCFPFSRSSCSQCSPLSSITLCYPVLLFFMFPAFSTILDHCTVRCFLFYRSSCSLHSPLSLGTWKLEYCVALSDRGQTLRIWRTREQETISI